ncbi:decaprenyl-phosphate phosphoribosyltransferase [Cohnella yongneupensis]|uniref:Decaprenyl-phosphate phosphoribosyltransferase n=1 Tax=Cohnella yongneupensis TaxID=425006 RepID=A0ABW0QVJ4_9BACL
MELQTTIPASNPTYSNVFKGLVRELRPKQWTKNLLVFASAMFAGTMLEPSNLINAFIAFICFSFMASTIYIINDIVDLEKDRLHPDKCHRPIASGAVTVFQAIITAIVLFVTSAGLGLFVNIELLLILGVYFALNLAYSLRLKHVVIIDVMIIAFGFVLRAAAGAFAVGLYLTPWFVLCTLLLSLFLALGKRRHELELFTNDPSRRRKVLDFYTVKLLDQLMAIVTGVVIMFYSMYAATEQPAMMYTIPFVIYGIFRYYYLVHMENGGGKPEEILLTDRHILVTIVLFGVAVIYVKQFV